MVAGLLLLLTSTLLSQDGDRWLILDKFSGLDLWAEETKLQPNQATQAKNIQFRKPGTISVLEALQPRDSVTLGEGPINGLGFLDDSFEAGRRLVAACSTLFWKTPIKGFTWTRLDGERTDKSIWQSWTDSTRLQDTGAVAPGGQGGRAAEFWRAGWRVDWGTSVDTIVYISDNNTVFMNDVAPQTGSEGSLGDGGVIPGSLVNNLPVKFVNIEADGTRMILALQAGAEPVVYRGDDGGGLRYFGVADSGTVQKVSPEPDDSSADFYIVDNTKIGLPGYGQNQLFQSRYWLHTPYYFEDTDSSHFGRVWPIDSNKIENGEFRIFFSTGDTIIGMPGGSGGDWADSLRGSNYQILSAPFLRDVITVDASPDARNIDGGTIVSLPIGTIDAHAYDHIPHAIFFEAQSDTLPNDVVDTSITCGDECIVVVDMLGRRSTRCSYVCDTTINTTIQSFADTHRASAFPIRAVYTDTVGTDSTIIWTSRSHPGRAVEDFTTSDWSISRLTIPFASDGVVYLDRLYLAGDPQDPNYMVFSEALRPGTFPTRNAIHIGNNGDVFVGFAKIYDWLVIFQEDHTWVLKGDPIGGQLVLALPDEGCISRKSIIELENRIIYLSAKGWRSFDGNTATDFGQAIKPAVQSFPRVTYSVDQQYRNKAAAVYDASSGNIWLSMTMKGDTVNSGSFLHNFVDGSFSFSDEIYGDNMLSLKYHDTLQLFFTSGPNLYVYGYGDSVSVDGVDQDSMNVVWSSGWLDFGHPEQSKYVQDGSIHLLMSTPSALDEDNRMIVSLYKDFAALPFYADTTKNVFGIVSTVYKVTDVSRALTPNEELQWMRIEITGDGLNVMDIRRLALRYRVVGDIVRDNDVVRSP